MLSTLMQVTGSIFRADQAEEQLQTQPVGEILMVFVCLTPMASLEQESPQEPNQEVVKKPEIDAEELMSQINEMFGDTQEEPPQTEDEEIIDGLCSYITTGRCANKCHAPYKFLLAIYRSL